MRRAAIAISIVLSFSAASCVQAFVPKQPTNPGFWQALFIALLGPGAVGTVFTPGFPVDLDGNGTPDGRVTDVDGDGKGDGVDLDGDGAPELVLIDTNGDGQPDAVDQNGDGVPDYYLCLEGGVIKMKTAPGCTGNDVTLIDTDSDGVADGVDTDSDGSVNDATLGQIAADAVVPTLAVDVPAGTYGSALNVTLTCSDNVAPGTIGYSINGAAPDFSGPTGTFANPPSVTVFIGGAGDGTYTLRALCRDAKGNLSTLLTAAYVRDSNVPSISVTTAPAAFISASGGAINSTSIEWQSNRSGNYDVRRNSTTCAGGTSLATGAATAGVDVTTAINAASHFGGEGAQSFTICVTDSGNGLVGLHVFQVTRDDTAPSVSASPATGNYSSVQSVTLSCSDAGAGCDKIAYTQAAGSTPADPAINGTTGVIGTGSQYSTALSAGDDVVTTTKARARDNAGNVSAVVTRVHTISSGVANITVNSTSTPVSGGNATIDWESSRAGAYTVKIGGTDCTNGSAATGTNVSGSVTAGGSIATTISNAALGAGSNTARVCVQNVLGNYGSTTTTIVKDTTNPSTSIDSPTTAGPHASGTTLSVSCDDGSGSGCKRIAYSTDGATPAFSGGSACTVAAGVQYTGTPTLSNGAYTIRAASCDNAGNVSSVGTLAVTVGPPSAPTISSATGGNGQISIAFSAVSGATSYTVYYKTSTGVATSDTSVGGTTSPIVVTGLTNGTTYYFALSASHAGGESSLSGESSSTPSAAKRIFITAATSAGNLGGLAGANAICQSDANKPNASTYKAILTGNSALLANQDYVRGDGVTVIGTTNGSASFASLTNPVGSGAVVWTGAGGSNCSTWTSSSGAAVFGTTGDPTSANSSWLNSGSNLCNSSLRLYCAEQ